MIRGLATTLVTLTIMLAADVASAQEVMIEGPLAGTPACHKCILYRQGRVSITPMFSFTLLDDYRRHIFIGGRLQYNISDWLALSISGGAGGFWGDLLDTGLTEEVAEKAQPGIESNRANFPFESNNDGYESARRNMTNLVGRIHGFISVELAFIPFRGKLGLFSRLFLDVDLYIYAGYAVPFVEERNNIDCRTWDDMNRTGGRPPEGVTEDNWGDWLEEECGYISSDETIPSSGTRVAVGAGTYGIGVSVYVNRWLSLVLEYRVMPFFWNHTGTDERGTALVDGEISVCPSDAGGTAEDYCSETGEFPDHRVNENDRTWTANHIFNVGMAFHFPLTPRRSE